MALAWVFSRPTEDEREALGEMSLFAVLASWVREPTPQMSKNDLEHLGAFRSRRSVLVLLIAQLPVLFFVLIGPGAEEPPPAVAPAVIPAPEAKKENAPPAVRTYVRKKRERGDALPQEVPREPDQEETLEEKRDPMRLFRTAKIIPLYNNEELLGITIGRVQEDSFWQMVGFQDGDLILEVNGELMDAPAASVNFMKHINAAHELIIRVRGKDGAERVLAFDTPEGE